MSTPKNSKKKVIVKQPKKLTKTDINKRSMILALERSLGIVTTACKSAGVSRERHYEWLKIDKDYATAVDSIVDITLDFAESQLHTKIQKGDTTATIFFLKCKGKKRGYVEREEVIPSNNVTIKVVRD